MSNYETAEDGYRLKCTPDIIVRFGNMAIDQMVELHELLKLQLEKVDIDLLRVETEIDWKLGVRSK
jgi:hypothetical protein